MLLSRKYSLIRKLYLEHAAAGLKFITIRDFHLTYTSLVRRAVASVRKPDTDVRDDLQQRTASDHTVSRNRNFYGIESDEGVIIIHQKSPSHKDGKSLLELKKREVKDEEKLHGIAFGVVRRDSENVPKYHGQYDSDINPVISSKRRTIPSKTTYDTICTSKANESIAIERQSARVEGNENVQTFPQVLENPSNVNKVFNYNSDNPSSSCETRTTSELPITSQDYAHDPTVNKKNMFVSNSEDCELKNNSNKSSVISNCKENVADQSYSQNSIGKNEVAHHAANKADITDNGSFIDECYFHDNIIKDENISCHSKTTTTNGNFSFIDEVYFQNQELQSNDLLEAKSHVTVVKEEHIMYPEKINVKTKFTNIKGNEIQDIERNENSYFASSFGKIGAHGEFSDANMYEVQEKEVAIDTTKKDANFKAKQNSHLTYEPSKAQKLSFLDQLYFQNLAEDKNKHLDIGLNSYQQNGAVLNSLPQESFSSKLSSLSCDEIAAINQNKISDEDLQSMEKVLSSTDSKSSFQSSSNHVISKTEHYESEKSSLHPQEMNAPDISETETGSQKKLRPNVNLSDEMSGTSVKDETQNQGAKLETAYDYVKNLRKEKKVIHHEIRKGKLPVRNEDLRDSKGFRILKHQVPNLLNFTRDEILEMLTQRVLYSDDNVIVLNKPYNLVIHESQTVKDVCLSSYLDDLAQELDKNNHNPKLYTVHRLDKETTGCLLLARNEITAQYLKSLFAQRKISKTYWIVTTKVPEPEE
ncbi:RNA pseudouridylate synthase domain-containing protein 4, partial [Stegodyphus mimosarum]